MVAKTFYVISPTSNRNFMFEYLEKSEFVATHSLAVEKAERLTRTTGEHHYVYQVDVTLLLGYKPAAERVDFN